MVTLSLQERETFLAVLVDRSVAVSAHSNQIAFVIVPEMTSGFDVMDL